MKISLHLPIEDVTKPDDFLTGEAVTRMAQAIEKSGAAAGYVTDHPIPLKKWLERGGHHALDPFVALSFAAAATKTLRLHTNLIVLPYRNPFLTAKSVASLDRLSDGRVIMGIGVGYLKAEFQALGVDFDKRGALVDEALDVMKLAWTGEEVVVEGTQFRAGGNLAQPTPVQTPHPPIWAGGNSLKAMRRAVKRCNGWCPFPAPAVLSATTRTDAIENIDDLKAKLQTLRDLRAEENSQGPFDICMTPFSMMFGGGGIPSAQAIEELQELESLGIGWSSIALPAPSRSEFLDNVAKFGEEVIAKL